MAKMHGRAGYLYVEGHPLQPVVITDWTLEMSVIDIDVTQLGSPLAISGWRSMELTTRPEVRVMQPAAFRLYPGQVPYHYFEGTLLPGGQLESMRRVTAMKGEGPHDGWPPAGSRMRYVVRRLSVQELLA